MTAILRLKGVLLTRDPKFVNDAGESVFEFPDHADVLEICNRIRAKLFPDVPMLEKDAKFDVIMRARADLEAAARKEKRGG